MPCPHDISEWEQAAKEVCEVSNKHKDPFVDDLLVAVYSEFERQYKEWEGQQNASNSGM